MGPKDLELDVDDRPTELSFMVLYKIQIQYTILQVHDKVIGFQHLHPQTHYQLKFPKPSRIIKSDPIIITHYITVKNLLTCDSPTVVDVFVDDSSFQKETSFTLILTALSRLSMNAQ